MAADLYSNIPISSLKSRLDSLRACGLDPSQASQREELDHSRERADVPQEVCAKPASHSRHAARRFTVDLRQSVVYPATPPKASKRSLFKDDSAFEAHGCSQSLLQDLCEDVSISQELEHQRLSKSASTSPRLPQYSENTTPGKRLAEIDSGENFTTADPIVLEAEPALLMALRILCTLVVCGVEALFCVLSVVQQFTRAVDNPDTKARMLQQVKANVLAFELRAACFAGGAFGYYRGCSLVLESLSGVRWHHFLSRDMLVKLFGCSESCSWS